MDISKGDRVRVIAFEQGGLPVGTLADVFWAGFGSGGAGKRGRRVGIKDRKNNKGFCGVEKVERIDAMTGATPATEAMAAGVFRLLSPYMAQTQQQTMRDGSITVTGRVRVRDVQHSDELDTLPAAIHGVHPNVRYTCDVEGEEHVYRFNCLASREVA